MKQTLFLYVFLGFTIAVQGQRSKWGISFTPALVSTSSTYYGFQPGVEYRLNDRLSLLTDVTIIMGGRKDEFEVNRRFFKIKPELRYSLTTRQTTLEPYTGIQLFYAFRKWDNRTGQYFEDELFEDSAINYTSATINSPVMGSSLQFGTLIHFSQKFSLDLFLGGGVRVIDTKYTDVQNKEKEFGLRPNCQILISPDPAYWVNGIITRFHMNLGLRFLYRF